MSIHAVYPDQYIHQLDDKIAQLKSLFTRFTAPEVEVFQSATSHYRMRAEFKIWHQDEQAYFAMFTPGTAKKPFVIDSFPVGSQLINDLMPKLLTAVNASQTLRQRLFQAEFLTTTTGEALITLIYHRPLDQAWESAARALSNSLGHPIIGRSKKQKLVLDRDYVTEVMTVAGREFRYQQVESGFTQPNAGVCQSMLNWAVESASGLSGDLLELYCGNGNFTLPLATCFNQVLATEISKTSVKSARYNLEQNQIENVTIVRMSSEEFSEAMSGTRAFNRLADIDLTSYAFSTVFVDPPRAGLDDHTTSIVAGFDNILYVSCNPATLAENLDVLCKTHDIQHFAAFDQFPYTPHLECGVLLKRRH